MSILASWIGQADLDAAEGKRPGLGPIAAAVTTRQFDEIHLLNNYSPASSVGYSKWLSGQTAARIHRYDISLSRPTDYGQIYKAATSVVSGIQRDREEPAGLVYHLSPGTPAMAAVWIIISKTKYPAELIESSAWSGVNVVSMPFDISAEFIPDLFWRPDSELERHSGERPPERPAFSDIIHRSVVMHEVVEKAATVAFRNLPVLLEGESGVGKELLARAIHNSGPRRDAPFVAVNCGAISPELMEAELFGHEKGAFTGAIASRAGYFESANGGTLFLDEAGELPKSAQVKLLRVIQESEVTRVGSSKSIKIDVRIISATNQSLIRKVTDNEFREDLFYRLAVAIISIPPLREREGDLKLLIKSLLEQVNRESAAEPNFTPRRFSPGAINALMRHHWPGNVRELLNTIRRAVVWSRSEVIGREEIIKYIFTSAPGSGSGKILNRPLDDGLDLQKLIGEVAIHYIRRAMELTGKNKTRAASLLGFQHYQTFTNWMEKYSRNQG
ncbi:MAG: sigma 54-interacting transcriptional regulator [Nitrospinota bacterium]|nr:sigma 54-interacting transcriptional regulator [Nitrospinota bacterium]